MIVVWGERDDEILVALSDRLEERDAPYAHLGSTEAPRVELCMVQGRPRGWIRAPGLTVPLEEVRSLYVRPGGAPPRTPAEAQSRAALTIFAETTSALVVNRPSAMACNFSKPEQLARLHALGFATPETLITTSPDEAARFVRRHGRVIYKSTSYLRSKVQSLRDVDDARWADIASCPTQFQAHVPGLDVRAHVIGDRVIAVQIESDAEDYRYPGERGPARRTPHHLPRDVEQACIRAAKALDLTFAGFDFRVGEGGEYVCFEANPSPAFTYYDHALEAHLGSEATVGSAVADLLIRGHSPPLEEAR